MVRRARLQDAAALSATLGAAFADDPVWSWLLPDAASRERRLCRFFALELRHVVLPRGEAWAPADGNDGSCLALPADAWRLPLRAQVAHGPEFARVFGRRLGHAFALVTLMERRHPRGPHVYIPYVGVAPWAQGRGLGSKLMFEVLTGADRDGLPVYLEASSARSAQLYERHGFVRTGEITVGGSPPLWPMLRPPGG